MTTPHASRIGARALPRPFLAASLAFAAAAIAPSCQLSGDKIDDHWTFDSVPPRITRAMTGFDASKESNYRDFAWKRKQANGLTFRRYFLNQNPDNPNQRPQESRFDKRPVNSILPNPWNYVHFEGLVVGFALTGGLVPLPIDSIIGTLEPGGWAEFKQGISETLTKEGVVTGADARALYGENDEPPVFQMTENAR